MPRKRGGKDARSTGIGKHTCEEQVAGTVTEPIDDKTEKVVTRYTCKRCGRDMRSDTNFRRRLW